MYLSYGIPMLTSYTTVEQYWKQEFEIHEAV
jgi:hypothetical protein